MFKVVIAYQMLFTCRAKINEFCISIKQKAVNEQKPDRKPCCFINNWGWFRALIRVNFTLMK